MNVAIIGVGNMGKGLARRLAGKVNLVVASRDQASAKAVADALPGVGATSIEDAARNSEIVILALPYSAALEVASIPALAGKIVVDITNPLKPDFSGLTIGHTTSAAEEIQKAAPSSKVVKAYNTIFAQIFDAAAANTANVPVFVTGDDEAAVETVAKLVELSGFAVEKAKGLQAARLLEPLGMLNIHLGYHVGLGTSIAPSWVKLPA
jgi:predicted dinucleotide-binding enzyme